MQLVILSIKVELYDSLDCVMFSKEVKVECLEMINYAGVFKLPPKISVDTFNCCSVMIKFISALADYSRLS